MPLMRCSGGWKWGEGGKCYPDKAAAIKQGVAIEGPVAVRRMLASEDLEAFEMANGDYLTKSGRFRKGNDAGTPRKRPDRRKGRPFSDTQAIMDQRDDVTGFLFHGSHNQASHGRKGGGGGGA